MTANDVITIISNITFVNLNLNFFDDLKGFYYTNIYQKSKVSIQATGIESIDVTSSLVAYQESLSIKA